MHHLYYSSRSANYWSAWRSRGIQKKCGYQPGEVGVHNIDALLSPKPNDDISKKSLIKMEVPAKGKSWTSSPDGHLRRPAGSPICPSLTEDGEKRQGSRVEGKDQWWRYLHTHSWNAELATVTSQKRASFASFYLPKWHTGKEFSRQCRRCRRLGFNHWVGKIPWKWKWQPTPVFLPRKFHRYRSLVGYSRVCKELGMTQAHRYINSSLEMAA